MRKGVYIVLLIFLIGFYYLGPNTMDEAVISGLLIIAAIAVIIFAFKKEYVLNLRGQYLKHSTLALIGILIVFFQFPLDFTLGNIKSSNLFIWVNKSIVVKSVTLSVIGLVCFFLGYLFYNKDRPKIILNKERPVPVNFLNLLAAASLLVYLLTVNPLYLAGYYGRVDMGSSAKYAILCYQVFIFASFIQKSRNMILANDIPNSIRQYISKIGWPLIILIGIYLITVLISGDRGPLIYYGLLLFSGYFYVTKRKLSWKYALLLFFVGASIITILGVARSLNKQLRFADKIAQSINEHNMGQVNSILPQTSELATSINTLNVAVEYVPSKHDFLWGRFQFQGITSVIPFFSVFSPLLFHDQSVKYGSSANFITWIIQGDYPTYGSGTSVMADFYLDFGLFGVIVGMFLFGYLMRYAEIAMYSNQQPTLFVHVFIVIYLCYAIYIARSAFLLNFKTVVWIYIMLLLNKGLSKRIRIKRIKYIRNIKL